MTGKRARPLFVGAIALLAAIIAVFAVLIVESYSQSQKDVRKRFRDRAIVSSALTTALLQSAATSSAQLAAKDFSGPTIPARKLEALRRQGQSAYIVIRDAQGKVVAATRGAPSAVAGSTLKPWVQAALKGRATLSSTMPALSGKGTIVEWAIPFKAPTGVRVEVVGFPTQALGVFLASFLRKLPIVEGTASAVLDDDGTVVATPERGVPAGKQYGDQALVAAVRRHSSGNYDGDRYFAAAPVGGSNWNVVLAVSTSRLYDEVNGSRKWVPWIVLLALASAGALGLWALRRAALAQAEVERRQLSRRTALEINDNVIQRLAVLKFALERGQEAGTQEKLAEALREAQKLVNQLLSEQDTSPGSLRRTEGAPVGTPGGRQPADDS